jgi:hypothetical protein
MTLSDLDDVLLVCQIRVEAPGAEDKTGGSESKWRRE